MVSTKKGVRVLGIMGAVCLVAVSAACEAPVTSEPVDVAAAGSTSSTSSERTLMFIEGSFDSATGEVSLAYRDPSTGTLLPEAVLTSSCDGGTCPYGESSGQVYLHTAGTHGDGYTNAPFAPPTYGATNNCIANVLCFGLSAENGMPGTLNNFTFVLDNITPSTVTFGLAASNAGTCEVDQEGTAPCTVSFGSVPHNAGFPTPTNTSFVGMGFDDAANNGANFAFSGHVTAS